MSSSADAAVVRAQHRRRWSTRGDVRLVVRCSVIALLAAMLLAAGPNASSQAQADDSAAQETASQARDLTKLSVEDLMNVEVTSVSKKEQKLSRVAAAIFVITQEDIRRSGATNIPDVLRMVPGLNVAQINANAWAISARGLNEQFAAKLLVMIDGRSVYTPTFGGVYWDTIDLPLEDIERIEVIRGPGGTVWGANAVNGVIDIITKSAVATPGGLLVAGGGSAPNEFGTAQYGGRLKGATDYRIYGKYMNQDSFPGLFGGSGHDGWHILRGGFRSDSEIGSKDKVMVEGNVYAGGEGQEVIGLNGAAGEPRIGHVGGFDLLSSWNRQYSDRSESTLQISFDRYYHSIPFKDNRNTFDITFEHYFPFAKQEIVWALDYRYTNHDSNSLAVFYDPSDYSRQSFSGFLQDEVPLIPERLYLTAGIKLEHNDYNGFDFLPSARIAWLATPKRMFWAAIARAERTPSSGDVADHVDGGELPGPGGLPINVQLSGNPKFKNEKLIATDAGFRTALSDSVSVDISLYYNSYSDLRTLDTGALIPEPSPTPHFILPLQFNNGMDAEAHGLEIAGNWKPYKRWSLKPGYAFERVHAHLHAASNDSVLSIVAAGGSPHNSAQLHSHVDIGRGVSWDVSAYFSSPLEALGVATHTRLDTGLTWRFMEKGSLSVVGQNLVKERELEYLNISGLTQSSLVKRSAYAKLTWQF